MTLRALGVDCADGDVKVLELPEPPQPGPAQVSIAVVGAGMGPWDRLLYTGGWDVGLRLPAALGVEGTGSVLAVGPEVTGFQVGDRVLAHEAPLPGGSGFWSEQVLVGAASVAHCPPSLDWVTAAALPIAGLTARQAIDALKIGPGSRLLITGGAGATGAAAVQIAAAAGASVTTTASAHHRDRLTRLGARQVVDYHQPDWPAGIEGSFDAALIAAPRTGAAAIALVRDEGRLLTLTSDAPESERGIESGDIYVEPNGAQLEQLAELVASGQLVLDAEPIRLQEAVAAFGSVSTSTTGGRKFVLTFS
jgi:NADPH:quinone reductase-like Zn-dependent oxidoreductase